MMNYSDPSKNPKISITQSKIETLIEAGVVFFVQTAIPGLTAGSVFDLFFDLSQVDSIKKLYQIESIYYVSSGSCRAEFWTPGASWPGGTQITTLNRNEESSNTAQSLLFYKTDGAPGNVGSVLPTSYQIAGTGVPASAGSGAKGDDFPIKINKSLSRVLRFSHAGTSPFTLDIRIFIAEIP